jgi:putative NIF3 family GTP cyclohydrolase 1 type 2
VKKSKRKKNAPSSKVKVTLDRVLRELERRAPTGTAESWDNVGLVIGGGDSGKVSGAVVSIDLTDAAIDLAVKKGFSLIVTHHPCIFPKGRGPSHILAPADHGDSGDGRRGCDDSARLYRAIRHGISVVSAHTNFDRCALEVSETVAQGLGLTPMGRLIDKPQESLTKLVVFAPESHVDRVRDAVCAAGAGQIGQYAHCSFAAQGTGTFKGGLSTQPFIGKKGVLERIAEVRLETIFPRGLEKPILKALRSAHPYEEIAYDLLPVTQAPGGLGLLSGLGYGVWGEVSNSSKSKAFSEVIRSVKSLFKLDGLLLTRATAHSSSDRGSKAGRIRRIGFVAGKGSSFLSAASRVGCDLFITGEVGYHAACEAAREGMSILEIGHRESECFFLSTVANWLREMGLEAVVERSPTQKFVT